MRPPSRAGVQSLIPCTFLPDGHRASALDRRMRVDLADSLSHICCEVENQWPGTDIALRIDGLRPVAELLRGDRRVCPALFSAYFRLVLCLANADGDANEALDDLLAVARSRDGFGFSPFTPGALGGDRTLTLYRRALDTDDRQAFSFLPPGLQAVERTRDCVTRALALMQRTAPELASEFLGVVAEVVLAAGSQEPGAVRFDGASSYQLWGALALNVNERKSDLEMMETLAHEAGHSFLFGMTVGEPLVLNNDDDLYKSPLRIDPRPMDGIYHATFVSARMHYAMSSARVSGALDADQNAECERFLAASRRAFEDGDSVVAAHGELSATGAALMNGARAFMAQVANATV